MQKTQIHKNFQEIPQNEKGDKELYKMQKLEFHQTVYDNLHC